MATEIDTGPTRTEYLIGGVERCNVYYVVCDDKQASERAHDVCVDVDTYEKVRLPEEANTKPCLDVTGVGVSEVAQAVVITREEYSRDWRAHNTTEPCGE